MTFAEELRHVVSVEPILDNSLPEPLRPIPGTASDEEWASFDIAYNVWLNTRIPKRRDPGLVRVLEVWEGFEEFFVFCQTKNLFNLPVWAEMDFKGTDREQLTQFLKIKVPLPSWAALWTQGTYFKLLVKVAPDICFYTFVIGSGITSENNDETNRALYDVGIREIIGMIHRTASDPNFLARARANDRLGKGRFELRDDPTKRYITSHRFFTERP